MKNIWFSILLLFLGAACTEEDFNYSDPTDIAMFAAEARQFYVTDAVTDNVIDLLVCSPAVSDVPRNYVVKLVPGTDPDIDAIEHTNFEMASSLVVTIPAGEYYGTFKLRAFHHTLYNDKDKLVYFTLSAMDEAHPVADFNNTLTVSLSKVCSAPLSELAGTYTLTSQVSQLMDDKNKVYNLKVYPDPDHADGLIIERPYSEDNLYLRLWQNETGRYTVVTREEVYLGPILSTDTQSGIPTDGSANGEFNPCSMRLELTLFAHPRGNANSGMTATEVFVKN